MFNAPTMRKANPFFWIVLACLTIAPALFAPALQAANNDIGQGSSRRLIYKVDPDYPWDLKRAHIGGVVRIVVVVTPRGTIDSVSVVGGNPVLVESAVRAVKKWKYAPADSETIVHVNVEFDPNR